MHGINIEEYAALRGVLNDGVRAGKLRPELCAGALRAIGKPIHEFADGLGSVGAVAGTHLVLATGLGVDIGHLPPLIDADGFPFKLAPLNYLGADEVVRVLAAQELRLASLRSGAGVIPSAQWVDARTPWTVLPPLIWPDFHLTLKAMGGTARRENSPLLSPAALNLVALVGPNDPLLCVAWAAREHERVMQSDGRSSYQSADQPANELETLLLRAAIDAFNRRGDTLGEARRRHAKRLAEVAAIFDAPVPSVSSFPPDGLDDEDEVST